MPLYPNKKPAPTMAYVAEMLAELEKLVRPKWPLLAHLIGMARLEAEGKVTKHH